MLSNTGPDNGAGSALRVLLCEQQPFNKQGDKQMQSNDHKPLSYAQNQEIRRLVWEYVGAARKYEYYNRDPKHLPEMNTAMDALYKGLDQLTDYGREG
jgi:hypothetical protein